MAVFLEMIKNPEYTRLNNLYNEGGDGYMDDKIPLYVRKGEVKTQRFYDVRIKKLKDCTVDQAMELLEFYKGILPKQIKKETIDLCNGYITQIEKALEWTK